MAIPIPTTDFILYAASFGLATLAAGLACVFMGYRLFVLGVMPREGSEIDARSGDIRLTLKNAAPGTCFAFFGATIVSLMLWVGIPELRLTQPTVPDGANSEFNLRGDRRPTSELTQQGQRLAEAGDLEGAIAAFSGALSDGTLSLQTASKPLVGLASVYRAQKRLDEAGAYARLVNQSSPTDAQALVLIALIEKDRGNLDGAIRAMRLATELDPTLKPDLAELEQLRQ